MKAFLNFLGNLKSMRPWVALLCICMLAFGGCAVAKSAGDFFFGVEEKQQVDDPATPDVDESKLPPVPTPKPGQAPSDWLSTVLGVLFPGLGIGSIGGALRLAWIEARKRALDGMFKAVVLGIKEAVDSAKSGKLNKEALYDSIQGARDIFANRDLFDKLVDEIKTARDAERLGEGDEGEVA